MSTPAAATAANENGAVATKQDGDKDKKAAAATNSRKEAAVMKAPVPLQEQFGKNPLLLLSYMSIVGIWGLSQVIYIHYIVHLLILVTAILYCACHASLVLREEPLPPPADGSEHDSAASSNLPERETLRKEDAYQFPLIGSASLFGLYLAFKYLDKDLVNLLIGLYFGVVGCFALTMTVSPVVDRLLFPVVPKLRKEYGWNYQWAHSLPEWILGPSPLDIGLECSGMDVVALACSAATCISYHALGKPWYLNNVLGISFCLQGIERFSLGTYKIGAILLVGLFFYDIFWVFGTEVMVTVAKSLDGPIKILFPRSLVRDPETGRLDLSLLGLGDIVIPGFFLALLLRFDAHLAKQPIHGAMDVYASFPKPYFYTTLIAYILGLGTTLAVMIVWNAAQPALLYLVPACLGASFACAVYRGEVKELLDYSEEVEEEEEPEDEQGDEAATKEGDKVEAKPPTAKKDD